MTAARANDFDVVIAGAGPAGTSAAIHLAISGLRVLLVEQKKFPRAKLCGEFISPECQSHFKRLGVAGQMMAAGPALLVETIFYSRHGHSVKVPSRWFGEAAALGLSRAVMDNNLLVRARQVGVTVFENTTVIDSLTDDQCVHGIRVRSNGVEHQYRAPLTLDATGRTRGLLKKSSRHFDSRQKKAKPRWIAFKAHFENTEVAAGVCEIYFYPGGYGGLSTVESGMSNLCFITSAADVRRCHSDTEKVLQTTVMQNRRAQHTLATGKRVSEWLSVSLESFGRWSPTPSPGLLAIGDSAAFIDPFTGSGMLMALESGELAARTILAYKDKLSDATNLSELSRVFREEYARKFDSRLRISGLLRRAAFKSRLAELGIALFGASDSLRNAVARRTRSNGQP